MNSKNIRIVDININGLDTGNGDHSLLQLCQTLQEKRFHIGSTIETNVHWKRAHIFNIFRKILYDT